MEKAEAVVAGARKEFYPKGVRSIEIAKSKGEEGKYEVDVAASPPRKVLEFKRLDRAQDRAPAR